MAAAGRCRRCPVNGLALLRWTAIAGLSLLLAARSRIGFLRGLGQFGAIAFAYGALAQVVPGWTLPIVMAGLVALMLAALRRFSEAQSEAMLLPFTALAVGLLAISGIDPQGEWLRTIGEGDGTFSATALARWGAIALLAAAWRALAPDRRPRHRRGAAALLGYGALAQIVPQIALPLVPPLALLAAAWWSRTREWPVLRPLGTVLVASSMAGRSCR